MRRLQWLLVASLVFGCDDVGGVDAGSGMDAAAGDAGAEDSGAEDSGAEDSGAEDAGAEDSGMPDAGMPDAGMPDAGMPDAGMPDAGMPDAGMPDAGMPDAGSDAGPVVCAAPMDFGVGPCSGDSDCLGMACWREPGPLPPGGCLFAGCSTRCAVDLQCQCQAAGAGASAPMNATCSPAGVCDLSGTGLGTPYLCS